MTLTGLEAIARAATQEPWAIESIGEKGDGANMIGVVFRGDDEDCERPLSGFLDDFDDEGNEIEYYRDETVAICEHRDRNHHANAAHIAAFDPPTVLALIEELKALLEFRDAWDAREELGLAQAKFTVDATAVSSTILSYATDPRCLDKADAIDGFRVLRQKVDAFEAKVRRALEGE